MGFSRKITKTRVFEVSSKMLPSRRNGLFKRLVLHVGVRGPVGFIAIEIDLSLLLVHHVQYLLALALQQHKLYFEIA